MNFDQVKEFFKSWGMYPYRETDFDDDQLNPDMVEQGVSNPVYQKLLEEAEREHGASFQAFCVHSIEATDGAFYLDCGTWYDLKAEWESHEGR